MARSDHLRRLFASYVRGDDGEFRRVAAEIVADERRKNHRLLASELEFTLAGDQRPGATTPLSMRPIPKSRDDRPLVQLTKPRRELDELVFAQPLRRRLEEIIRENLSRSALTSYGLRPRQRLLFVGTSGTGKSAAAHAIAAQLSLPVATASLAALTSSFLGDTARNIEAVVTFAEHTPCVLLFDEFDVLGQERAQQGDHGEMRRVAAAVLQLLEEARGESLIVATSNHAQLVDTAIWRRFDELVAFDMLGPKQIARVIALRLRAVGSSISADRWAHRLEGFSPAEVELVCFDAMRRAVLDDHERVDNTAMAAALESMRVRRSVIEGSRGSQTPSGS